MINAFGWLVYVVLEAIFHYVNCYRHSIKLGIHKLRRIQSLIIFGIEIIRLSLIAKLFCKF